MHILNLFSFCEDVDLFSVPFPCHDDNPHVNFTPLKPIPGHHIIEKVLFRQLQSSLSLLVLYVFDFWKLQVKRDYYENFIYVLVFCKQT